MGEKNRSHDFEKQNLEIIKKNKENLKSFENENQINRQKLSKYEKLNEKLEFENKKSKSREKLLDEKIENLYITNHVLENKSKENLQESPKMETPWTSKENSNNNKVRTKLNSQSNDEIFEKKQEFFKSKKMRTNKF